jgi:hypothetical protein
LVPGFGDLILSEYALNQHSIFDQYRVSDHH